MTGVWSLSDQLSRVCVGDKSPGFVAVFSGGECWRYGKIASSQLSEISQQSCSAFVLLDLVEGQRVDSHVTKITVDKSLCRVVDLMNQPVITLCASST